MANDIVALQKKLRRGPYDDASFLRASGAESLVLNSFTGADITCSILLPTPQGKDAYLESMGIDPADYPYPTVKVFAELETLTISSARSLFPVRRLGEVHVHKYTRGGRTIAGTMVFTTFSRDVFAEFYRLHPNDSFVGMDASSAPFFVDQIPPFHIMLSAVNEYGIMAHAALINVHLSNWGTALSVHDLKVESTYTYSAQFFFPFVQDYKAFQQQILKSQSLYSAALSEAAVQRNRYNEVTKVRTDGTTDTDQIALDALRIMRAF